MPMMSSFDKCREIFAEALNIPLDDAVPEASIYTVPTWDSFSTLRLIVALDAEMGVELSDDEILELRSFGALTDILKRKGIL